MDPARWQVRKDPPYNREFMPVRDVVILGAARTPIGRYGGIASQTCIRLSSAPSRRARRSSAPASAAADVDEVLIGHGRQAGSGPEPRRGRSDAAPAFPTASPAQTINKACASGLQAIALGAQAIMLGESDVVLAGGIESMSRMPYLIDAMTRAGATRWATSRSSTRCTATAFTARCRT